MLLSCGCAAPRSAELGLGTGHEGIWVLPEDAVVGTLIAEYLGLTDTVIDLEITPNRPDWPSMVGFAREVGAMYGLDWREPAAQLEEADESIEGQVQRHYRRCRALPLAIPRVSSRASR